jgi:GT2 family glycosyltransferase
MIVVNYNGKACLRECINSLLHTDYPNFEILIVDNGSEDGSLESVRRLLRDGRLRQLRLEENVGYAAACNSGARHVSGRILVFLNNDLEVDPKWLRPLVSLMQEDPTVGAIQPKLVLKDSPEQIDAAGGFIDIFGCAHERRGLSTEYTSICEVFYAKGAAILVSSDEFAKLGGFDDDFFLYYEETDLCWRLWLSGHRVMYVPSSIVYHAGAATTSSVNLERRSELYSMVRLNRSRMILKNYEIKYLFLLTPIILLNNLKDTLVLMLLGARLSAVLATLKVPWLLLKDLRTTLTKRYSARQFRKISNRKLLGRIIMPKGPIFFPHELGDLPLKRRRMLEWIQTRSSKL